MKTFLLTFVLFFFVTIGLSQSINDHLYKKINDYRKSLGVHELFVDNRAKVFNDQQLNYMIQTSTVPLDHTQKIKTKYPKTFNTFVDRVNYIYKDDYEFVGENLISIFYEGNDEEIAEKIFNLWLASPSHNLGMISKKPVGFYINYRVSNKLITPSTEIDGAKILYCVLTTYK